MKHFMIILASILLVSCGMPDKKASYNYRFASSDPTFNQYKQDFEADYLFVTGKTISTQHIRINLAPSIKENPAFAGICYASGNHREIVIKASYWNFVSDESKKALVYHELGHCALGRGHDDQKLENQPLSIMNTYIIDGSYLKYYYEEYITELFTSNKNDIVEVL